MCLNLEIKLVVILQIHKKNETDPEADLSIIVVFVGIPQIGSRIATTYLLTCLIAYSSVP